MDPARIASLESDSFMRRRNWHADFEKFLRKVASGPSEAIAKWRGSPRYAGEPEGQHRPAQVHVRRRPRGRYKPTARQGRARGFLATWCGPCIGELPNVIANYQKYHDKGFEIVGVSFENAGLADAESVAKLKERPRCDGQTESRGGRQDGPIPELDTPEAAVAKLAKAKQKMLDFTWSAHALAAVLRRQVLAE